LNKSKQYLEKVKKQGGFESDDFGKAFNFHKVLKDQLDSQFQRKRLVSSLNSQQSIQST
jgi:hypothetical protein